MKKTATGSLVVGSVVAGMLLGSVPVNGEETAVSYTVAEEVSTYTLEIPATLQLSKTETVELPIQVSDVSLATGKGLRVRMAAGTPIADSKLTLTSGDDTLTAAITNGTEGSSVTQGGVIAQTATDTVDLVTLTTLKVAPPSASNPSPGDYTETLTFTASLESTGGIYGGGDGTITNPYN